jgi:argininosuccinate lyase
MKLWQKGFDIDQKIEMFTVGKDRELDLFLAPFDVLGSIAHGTMLAEIGLLTMQEKEDLISGLRAVYARIETGGFVIEEGVEDVHSQVEQLLTQMLGDTGKKIHAGRSRNDQVLLDIRLYIRHEIIQVVERMEALFHTLQKLSEQYQSVLMPGYTHFQVAMPSSFGLWFGAYAESLADDLLPLLAAYRIANQNPLGSAAGYGSSFPLNRTRTTELLGFDTLSYNVVYAQMGRGKTERTLAHALSGVAATLGKMAMDITLFMCQNFAFLTFPDHLTTGSSIMPHKKNPDVFELIRARCNMVQGSVQQMSMLTTNLPSGYHRDLQLLKESMVEQIEGVKACLEMTDYMIGHVQVREQIVESPTYKYMFSVEVVNQLVQEGMSFRDAYRKVGEMIGEGTYQESHHVAHTHEGSIGNLCTAQIRQKFEENRSAFQNEKVAKAYAALLGR